MSIELIEGFILAKADPEHLATYLGVESPDEIPRKLHTFCMQEDLYRLLSEAIDRIAILRAIADELGVNYDKKTTRDKLVAQIISQLGFPPLKLIGVSNMLRKVKWYQEVCFPVHPELGRPSLAVLRDTVMDCASMVETLVKNIFALHSHILWPLLTEVEQEKIAHVIQDNLKFGTVVQKLRQLDRRVAEEIKGQELRDHLDSLFGRKSIMGKASLDDAQEVATIRGQLFAHKMASMQSIEGVAPSARRLMQLSLQFIEDVQRFQVCPRMIVQVRYEEDDWGRERIYFLDENRFDKDGNPLSDNFDEWGRVSITRCSIMYTGKENYRPRMPCFCVSKTENFIDDPLLFFQDELTKLPGLQQ
jgi:hypothetical protein